MRSVRRLLIGRQAGLAALLSAGLLAMLPVSAGASQSTAMPATPKAKPGLSAKSSYGCPYGALCLYKGNRADSSPDYAFYSYGAHNLSNVYGNHVIYHNQYGGAGFRVCYGYNGRRCSGIVRHRGLFAPYDFTPINSVVLTR